MDTKSKELSSSGYCLLNASSDTQIIVYVPYPAVLPNKTTYRGSSWKKYFFQLFVIIKTMALSPMNFIAVSFTIDYRLDYQLQCVLFVNYVMLCHCQRLSTRKGALFIVYILRSVTYIQFFWGANEFETVPIPCYNNTSCDLDRHSRLLTFRSIDKIVRLRTPPSPPFSKKASFRGQLF